MNAIISAREATKTAEWLVRLDCGHDVPIPWSSAGAAAMGYLVSHLERCSHPEPPLLGPEWRAVPMLPAPEVSSR